MLKPVFYIIILSLGISFAQNSSNEKQPNQINLIISLNSFHNAKTEDAQAIAEILANHIKKLHNLNYQFEVKTPVSMEEIENAFGTDFDCSILTTEEFLNLQNKLPLEPINTNYTNGNIGYKYLLLVNKDDNITDIRQLKNESINILARETQKAPFLWVEKLLRENGLKDYKKFFKSVSVDYKATNVVLPVFFGKINACIVTESSYNLLCELNPSIKSKLKVLQSTDNILLGMVCLNKNKKDKSSYSLLKEIFPTLQENEYGKQLLYLFSADKLVPYKNEYLQNYLKLLK